MEKKDKDVLVELGRRYAIDMVFVDYPTEDEDALSSLVTLHSNNAGLSADSVKEKGYILSPEVDEKINSLDDIVYELVSAQSAFVKGQVNHLWAENFLEELSLNTNNLEDEVLIRYKKVLLSCINNDSSLIENSFADGGF